MLMHLKVARSDHLFTSEDMISGYSEAKKQRRRRRVDNKETWMFIRILSQQLPTTRLPPHVTILLTIKTEPVTVVVVTCHDLLLILFELDKYYLQGVLQTPTGTSNKAASRLSHDRTPLSCLTNIGQSSNTYRDKRKARLKENVFHSNRNSFEEISTGQLEDICESYDDTVENSRIHGLSDYEDFYSDDYYEEDYCTSQSLCEDNEDDWITQKTDEDHIKPIVTKRWTLSTKICFHPWEVLCSN